MHLVIAVVATLAAFLGLVLLGSHIDVISLLADYEKRDFGIGLFPRTRPAESENVNARIATPRLYDADGPRSDVD